MQDLGKSLAQWLIQQPLRSADLNCFEKNNQKLDYRLGYQTQGCISVIKLEAWLRVNRLEPLDLSWESTRRELSKSACNLSRQITFASASYCPILILQRLWLGLLGFVCLHKYDICLLIDSA